MSTVIQQKLSQFIKLVDEFPEIRYIGNPVLRSMSEKATLKEGQEIGKHLGEILVRIRSKVGYGRGLASPQIGINKKVFVTFLHEAIQIYINPSILERSDTTNYYRELCLSSGIIWCDVERPESIVLEWTDEKGKTQKKFFDGVIARLIQHEVDHLNGIVNLDKALPGTIELVTKNPLDEKLRSSKDYT